MELKTFLKREFKHKNLDGEVHNHTEALPLIIKSDESFGSTGQDIDHHSTLNEQIEDVRKAGEDAANTIIRLIEIIEKESTRKDTDEESHYKTNHKEKSYSNDDFDEKNYKFIHFLYWIIEKYMPELKENLSSSLKSSMPPLQLIHYCRRPFFDLWVKVKKNEPISKECFSTAVKQHLANDEVVVVLEDAEVENNLINIGINFVQDVKKIKPLILEEAWKDKKFMEKLQEKVKLVPLTRLGVLNVTCRSKAKEVVEGLKLMVEESNFHH